MKKGFMFLIIISFSIVVIGVISILSNTKNKDKLDTVSSDTVTGSTVQVEYTPSPPNTPELSKKYTSNAMTDDDEIMEKSLENSIDIALEEINSENLFSIKDKKHFMRTFNQLLVANLDSDLDLALQTRVINLDLEKGVFRFGVTGTYHLNDLKQTEKQIVVDRMVIFW